jgi:hypothetical protein
MRTMKDWQKTVREHLEACNLPREIRDDVVIELAAHLEEAHADARAHDLDDAEAVEQALQEAGDWNVLAENIARAPHEEEQSMNNRTKSFWLPALASFTTASLFLLALTKISMQPQSLVRLNSGLGRSFYFGWVVAQIFFGALGAFLSRRAGGSRAARILAGIFPAIVMFVLWAVVIPASAVAEHNAFVLNHPLYYALGIFVWVVPPGAALLAGTAPFLKESKLHEAKAY